MRVTTDDGVGLEVERLGDGPPFVLVHGFTGAKEDFADHAPRFAEHLSVVTFDHRGHGASDKPDDPAGYTLERLAADTIQVMDALELGRVRLLGHSMGGMVARRLVLEHPDRVEALVLMDTSHGPPRSIDPQLALLAGEVAMTDGMAALRLLVDEVKPLGTAADDRVRAERPGYIEFGDRKWDAMAPAAYAGLARSIVDQPDQLDALHALECPTLVVVGEQDTPFLADSEAMAAVVPGATLRVIADAGHSPQFEAPEPWFRAVDGFVRSLAEPVSA
jgi:pimeloyl-ACP methyl ester carboxylesterase